MLHEVVIFPFGVAQFLRHALDIAEVDLTSGVAQAGLADDEIVDLVLDNTLTLNHGSIPRRTEVDMPRLGLALEAGRAVRRVVLSL